MFRAAVVLLSAVALLAPAAARAADEPKDVLARAVKAHGGEEKLTKLKAGQASTKGKLNAPGLGEVEITQEIVYQLPDKFKETVSFTVMGTPVTVETVANGDALTITANGQKVPIPDAAKSAVKDAQGMIGITRLVPLLKDKKYKLSPVGEVEVEGKPAVGVQVSVDGKKDYNLFFSKETGLLVKLEHRTVDGQTGKEITEERVIHGYRDRDGIPMPKRVVVKHDGEAFLDVEVQDAKLLESVDASEFAK